jgi:hypothetical protein
VARHARLGLTVSSGLGQVRLWRLRPATARLAFHCGHHPALPRTAAVGQERTQSGQNVFPVPPKALLPQLLAQVKLFEAGNSQ